MNNDDVMMFNPDEAGEERKFEIPAADSEVVLVVRKEATEWRNSKRTGNRYLNVRLETMSGPGKGYWFYYTIPEGQYQSSFLGRLMDACGLDTKSRTKVTIGMLIGCRCKVRVKHEVRDGERRAVINYFLKYDPAIEGMTDDKPKVTRTASSAPVRADSPSMAKEAHDDLPF